MLRMPSLLESRNNPLHLWTSLGWKRIQPNFSPVATGSSLNSGLRHQKGSTSWCSERQDWGTERAFRGPQRAEEMYQKQFWWNSRSFPNEIQNIVIRNSKLAGPRRSASRRINWHRKTTPTAHPLRSMRDIRTTGKSHWTNQAEMHRWNSDQTSEQQPQLWTVSTANLEQSDLNQFLFINTKSGIRLVLPVLHGGSGIKNLWSSKYFLICCSRIV